MTFPRTVSKTGQVICEVVLILLPDLVPMALFDTQYDVLVPENETSTVYPIKDSDKAYTTHQIKFFPGFEGRCEKKS